ncbi:hypothetical protein ElyMa_005848200 [Elysia marginata]|uniref:Reelin domain-containing protein n=1 Tax=Elysia marginata TaxID=1093978 RepID=A0AAV4FYF9_9GAST|nr:hypothetical protein ElyMa_005848200 [Elysia marginata]
MNRSVLAVVLMTVVVVGTSQACSNGPSTADLSELFCSSSVVFKGTSVSATSSQYYNEQDQVVVGGSYTYNVTTFYKNAANAGPEARVFFSATGEAEASDCHYGAYSGATSSVDLVFATGSRFLSMASCRDHIPGDCVPEEFWSTLPDVSCD